MTHNRYLLWPALAILALAMACTNDEIVTTANEPLAPPSSQTYTYKLRLNMAYPGSSTRGEVNHDYEWPDNSRIQFSFTKDLNKGTSTSGVATYHKEEGEWTAEAGQLPLNTSMLCAARYLKSDAGETPAFLTPTYTGKSKYVCSIENENDSVITIDTLSLHPATWRMRFKGTEGTQLNFFSNDIIDDQDKKLSATLSLSVAGDGYTPYIYALFANSDGDNTINVETGGKTYHKTINGTDIKLGGSKMLNVPTESNYETEGWRLQSTQDQHVAVDLGLPSGTLWANMNVGATSPEDYGYYIAWGETEFNKEYYGDSSYKWLESNKLTKYCTNSSQGKVDNKSILDAEDDAATVNWGGKWRTPTSYECEELINNCKWEWTSLNDIDGYLVSGKNGNSIFLPAAGYKSSYSIYWVSKYGMYLSSRKQTYLRFDGTKEEIISKLLGYDGYTLRPVKNKDNQESDFINITEQLPVFGINGGSSQFTIDSNVSWKIHSNQTWCSVDKDQGQGKATITLNVTGGVHSDSTAILTITQVGGSIVKSIEVKYRYFEVSERSYEQYYFSPEQELLPDERNFSFWILSNVNWEIKSTVDWLHANSERNSNYVSVTADDLSEGKRKGEIKIWAYNFAPIIINVTDEVPTISIEPKHLEFSEEGETKSFSVQCSREDWEYIGLPSGHWTVRREKNQVYISCFPNTGQYEKGPITFKVYCHGVEDSASVTQKAKTFTPNIEEVSPNPLIFESNPTESKQITVKSNMNLEPSVTRGETWCHIESYTDQAITIKADKNDDNSNREATILIVFKHDGEEKDRREVTVKQNGTSNISVTPFGPDEDWDNK